MLTVISLGGSLIYPKKADKEFINDFIKLISKYTKKGHRFAIYCGGGHLARKRQKAFFFLNKYLLDWIGILATRKNAEKLKKYFKINLHIHKKTITNPTKKIDFKEDVLLAAGWKPGWSTDYDAVLLAKNLGSKKIINMTNVDYVYDSDPKKNKNTKPIKDISWKKFRKIVGEKWKPGLNMPFDPIASKEAEKSCLEVDVIGKSISNLKKLLDKRSFKGTSIR